MEILIFIISLVLLIKAADFFVDAGSSIAKIFHISEIIIGATIVSIGTTLPETMVSATSALSGHGDIAFGNALGSIICNTALIASLPIVFLPGVVSKKALKVPVIFFFLTYVFYVFSIYVFKGFPRIIGIILVLIFIVYVVFIVKFQKNSENIFEQKEIIVNEVKEEYKKEFNKSKELYKNIIILVVSAIIIAIASKLLVNNGILLAKRFGVPEAVIGITVIAIGTSLPELMTAIISIRKKHANLSIGNIIGANFLNLVNTTGIAAMLSPFSIPKSKIINGLNAVLIIDVPLALILMLIMCIPSLTLGKTKRWQGVIMLILYIGFMLYQVGIN